ncbi:MAG: hypothetical protein ACYSSP_14320 [Planctomycetota bacterium]|jgi:hypothetical protein
MNHLTDEQFEDIIQGEDIDLAHLKQCKDCQNRLTEKQAIAERLRSAFNSTQASSDLAERIHHGLDATAGIKMPAQPSEHTWLSRRSRQFWPVLATAAAILIVIVPLSLYFGAPSAASAAQAELVKIHNHNLSPGHEFYSEAEPEKLAEYFKDKLGFNPRLPESGQGMALRGCCVRHFRGKIVGSYVVETPEGVMSIVVVTDKPESLGIKSKFQKDQYTYWKSSFAKCDMVTVRIDHYSYCAVGEISHEYLTELLSQLLPRQPQ